MNRRAFLTRSLAGAFALAVATPGAAAGIVDDLVAELRGQGFTSISVSRTMLGRVRIAAKGADGTREIVLNPNSGEILRDLWTSSGRNKASLLPRKGSGKDEDEVDDEDKDDDKEDDDKDDKDDDDKDDDRSGSGGGGGGSSGSGGGDDDE